MENAHGGRREEFPYSTVALTPLSQSTISSLKSVSQIGFSNVFYVVVCIQSTMSILSY